MKTQRIALLWSGLLAVAVLTGCQSPSESVSVFDKDLPYANIDIQKPDFIVVEDFSVTSAEIRRMEGISPAVLALFSDKTQTERETEIGRMLAKTLKEELVKQLNTNGFQAYPAGSAPQMSYKTGIIKGFFYEINEGDRTLRNLLGFGLGQSKISMRVMFNERQVRIAAATVETKTELKLSLLPVVAVLDEATRGTIASDARRAAVKITEELVAAYKKRGWIK
jgi:hypothetical protein